MSYTGKRHNRVRDMTCHTGVCKTMCPTRPRTWACEKRRSKTHGLAHSHVCHTTGTHERVRGHVKTRLDFWIGHRLTKNYTGVLHDCVAQHGPEHDHVTLFNPNLKFFSFCFINSSPSPFLYSRSTNVDPPFVHYCRTPTTQTPSFPFLRWNSP